MLESAYQHEYNPFLFLIRGHSRNSRFNRFLPLALLASLAVDFLDFAVPLGADELLVGDWGPS